MLDFLMISRQAVKKDTVEIFPKFVIKKSADLMTRGGDFYAVWVEDSNSWSTEEQDAIDMIDKELKLYSQEYKKKHPEEVVITKYLWDSSTGMIDRWHKYVTKQMRDNFHALDERLIFSNMETKKTDYASKKLSYPLEEGDYSAWDDLVSVLYSPEEKLKIEWSIGAIVHGDSKRLQKFVVLYGEPGSGKGTVLSIIDKLFNGYTAVFSAKALGSGSNQFALEAFKSNPLVAIENDGNLSRIDDNTRLNSLVSHEKMLVNEKYKSTYSNHFKSFLFIGSNEPVKITNAKSGLIRRLIDISPTGHKMDKRTYNKLLKEIDFELGAIAYHCLEVYKKNMDAFDDYIPLAMLGASNDFYNFVEDSYFIFKKEDGTSLSAAWKLYDEYCNEAKVGFPLSKRAFREELKNYFWECKDRYTMEDGSRIRNYYIGFRWEKFESGFEKKPGKVNVENVSEPSGWLEFKKQKSIFDEVAKDYPAQYAVECDNGLKPEGAWDYAKTCLKDIDVSKVHYVKVPLWHIVIDFDIPDENGNKCFEKNLEAANKWPKTYAELSKSGGGIHLHYIYKGEPEKLNRLYDEHIEVKVFSGKSALRRKLTLCNDIPIAEISSGLSLKEEKNVVSLEFVHSENSIRRMIKRNLNKEYHPSTASSIDFIKKILDDAYASGIPYDVSDMRQAVLIFASGSTNQAERCIKQFGKMRFTSENTVESDNGTDEKPIAFYDIEVFPNLLVINWKLMGRENPVIRMINPEPIDIQKLIENYRLIGFNCRRYDNHIVYAAAYLGYTIEQLYNLSQKIINTKKGTSTKGTLFSQAYNLSYTDIYDFASAGNKKSLKKLEIEMGIHHQELGLDWNKPVPPELWFKVAEYCDNDVKATEEAFYYLSADWMARQILADITDSGYNETTNNLTTKFMFGKNRNPQNEFKYRNLAEPVFELDEDVKKFLNTACPTMMSQRHGEAGSLLPYFPGYEYKYGKSTYKGVEVGEGGYVYAETGMYGNVALLDIASMHPHSVIAECLFGPNYTAIFREIVEARVKIKHEEWDTAKMMLNQKLSPFIQKVIIGEITSKDLANALKTAINSIYGLTSAKFENPFRDERNVDNIVAKRGALFMVDLKEMVENEGFTVAHIKTDSIKIPDATPDIIQKVMEFGKKYGYTFEHEATYDRMCLVNNAVYIAKYKDADACQEMYGYIPDDNKKKGGKWTATGTQFAVPYVFKKLFSKEDITFDDLCETKSVQNAIYLDMNENLPDVTEYEKQLDKLETKYKHGELSDELFEKECSEIMNNIRKGHDNIFVGKVGQFCPVKDGYGGGLLVSEKDGKYNSVTGTKGYRWLESEALRAEEKTDAIDMRYYNNLVDEAVSSISQYGNFEWFVSDDPYIPKFKLDDFMDIPIGAPESIPFR